MIKWLRPIFSTTFRGINGLVDVLLVEVTPAKDTKNSEKPEEDQLDRKDGDGTYTPTPTGMLSTRMQLRDSYRGPHLGPCHHPPNQPHQLLPHPNSPSNPISTFNKV